MPSDSEAGIASAAFRRLGANGIVSFTDPTTEGILANDTYDQIRDDYLRDHPWAFATKRVELAASANAPAWGFLFQYPVPGDFLRLLEVDEQNLEAVKVENTSDGTAILTDLDGPLKVRYIARIVDPTQMDAKFKEGLIWKCAATWAESLTATSSIVDRAVDQFRRADAGAKAADGQQGTPDRFGINEWVNAR
jgi:hypothetical protein